MSSGCCSLNHSLAPRNPRSKMSTAPPPDGAPISPNPESRRPALGLIAFFLLSYAIMLGNTSGYLSRIRFSTFGVAVFSIVVQTTYSAIYLIPSAIVVCALYLLLFRRGAARQEVPRGRRLAIITIAVILTAATQIFIHLDGMIFDLFGFHLNGFAWNLVTTPGGIESLGGGSDMRWAALLLALLFVLVQVVAAAVVTVGSPGAYLRQAVTVRIVPILLAVFVVASVGERLTFGWSALKANVSILTIGHCFPFYKTTSVRSLAKKAGIEIIKRRGEEIEVANSRIRYPLSPLVVTPPARKPNIVLLTVESLRADMLTPEIMPATWKFAQKSHRFTRHYSGGNGTRMGMFALFYGIYGNYWFPFLAEQRSPILIDMLKQQGYQFSLHTSARFTYPEFDKTIFSSFPAAMLQEATGDTGWEKDRQNVGQIIDFIGARDKESPFMVFMFFESPHADYDFPDESIIREPYLEKLNYATMDPERDMPLVFNRYVNAVHHLDSQVARIIDELERQQLMEDTIVILTGDHGEEFMEEGRWGHNSAFSEEQIRTPLVLRIPGTGSGTIERMTSHLDVVPTIMPHLGVQNPAQDYCLGFDLLGDTVRTFTVVADWSKVCYIDDHYKAAFGYKAGGDSIPAASTITDDPIADDAAFEKSYKAAMLAIAAGLARFLGAPGA